MDEYEIYLEPGVDVEPARLVRELDRYVSGVGRAEVIEGAEPPLAVIRVQAEDDDLLNVVLSEVVRKVGIPSSAVWFSAV